MVGIARALSGALSTTAARARPRRRPSRSVAFAALIGLVALNLAVFLLPIDYRAFGAWTYPGVFIVTFIANAAIALPVPYLPIIGQVARTAELVPLVVVTAALASVLGESVSYAVGRAEKDLFADHPVYLRLQRLVGRPWRASLALFLFAAPPNPLFESVGSRPARLASRSGCSSGASSPRASCASPSSSSGSPLSFTSARLARSNLGRTSGGAYGRTFAAGTLQR